MSNNQARAILWAIVVIGSAIYWPVAGLGVMFAVLQAAEG